ncbi:MAG: hypothetical protein ACR2P6_02770 [Gammaproteobacteria bacterium]
MTGLERVFGQMDLRGGLAVWVLSAHFYAVLVPLVLIWAVHGNWEYVVASTDRPEFFYVAVGLMMAGSAFEVAQNTVDRWYLTPDVGSADGIGFCDLLFFWFVVASQAAIVIACVGDIFSLTIASVFIVMVFPVFYLRRIAPFLPMSLLGVAAAIGAYVSFGDPIIFLQILLPAITMFFYGLLLRTGAQILHGFTTVAASSGVVFLAWGISNGAQGAVTSWVAVVVAVVLVVIAGLLVRPSLARLSPTPRSANVLI